ncbi:MAG: ABC transporter permease [Armatimonadetes bacterium]|nr:ABC transporter permease [Armatimonadota bacterium]
MRNFELRVAWRHLLTGHGQTELTVGAVAVGVLLVVFLSSLINGLQIGLVEDVVGSIPHITVEAATPGAKPLWRVPGRGGEGGILVSKLEKMATQKRKVQQWRRTADAITRLPGVDSLAPTAEGSGFAARGAKNIGAVIMGVVPNEQMRVGSLKNRIIEGDFAKVDQQNAAIGVKMADDIGAGIGSRIRVTSNEGVTQTFRVAAIFDLGVQQANESWVYMGLPAAQGLLKIGKDVTTINVRAHDIYSASRIADEIRSFSPLLVTSWMESNKAFLDTLTAQNSAALIIQGMTLLASAFGVASVMIVFVVQKSRDIGILKSMGATSRQIQKIFVLEGLGVGLGGAVLGSALGTGLCFMVQNTFLPGQMFGGKPATLVPMNWDISYVMAASVVAVAVGLTSSVVPARRAARLDPVEAIRHG